MNKFGPKPPFALSAADDRSQPMATDRHTLPIVLAREHLRADDVGASRSAGCESSNGRLAFHCALQCFRHCVFECRHDFVGGVCQPMFEE